MTQLFIVCLVYFFVSREVNAAKILAVFPIPSISHQVVFRPLTQELVRRGHEVTVITTDPAFTKDNRPANLTEIDVHDITYSLWLDRVKDNNMKFGSKDSTFAISKIMSDFLGNIIGVQLRNRDIQTLIKERSKYFDLLIIEAFGRPHTALTHVFKVPLIQISSLGMMLDSEEIVGAPKHIFLYPPMMHQRIYNLTFWEKIFELYLNFFINYNWDAGKVEEHRALRKIFGDDLPNQTELNKNVDMLFLNIHPIWSNNQPLPPNVISIWGIYRKPEKPLPEDLKSYLDSSKNGVIYLSFGSNVQSSMLSPEKIQMFINTFSKLPYDVLWKWEKDVLPGKSKNIRISKWLPQSDLLRHPKIKLFITQGGLQSTDEAINAGVPLIGIPMFADQWYNVERYEYHKIGVLLNLVTLTEDKLKNAIDVVINNESYRKNIIKLRELLDDQPESALDRAVWWTDYVLRHGGAKHLRAAAANMSWAEYYEIDFILKLLTLLVLLSVILIMFLYSILNYILRIIHPKPKLKAM